MTDLANVMDAEIVSAHEFDELPQLPQFPAAIMQVVRRKFDELKASAENMLACAKVATMLGDLATNPAWMNCGHVVVRQGDLPAVRKILGCRLTVYTKGVSYRQDNHLEIILEIENTPKVYIVYDCPVSEEHKCKIVETVLPMKKVVCEV